MTTTERKVIKVKVGLLELAKQLGSVTMRAPFARRLTPGSMPSTAATGRDGYHGASGVRRFMPASAPCRDSTRST